MFYFFLGQSPPSKQWRRCEKCASTADWLHIFDLNNHQCGKYSLSLSLYKQIVEFQSVLSFILKFNIDLSNFDFLRWNVKWRTGGGSFNSLCSCQCVNIKRYFKQQMLILREVIFYSPPDHANIDRKWLDMKWNISIAIATEIASSLFLHVWRYWFII